jgi:hypothetical protein
MAGMCCADNYLSLPSQSPASLTSPGSAGSAGSAASSSADDFPPSSAFVDPVLTDMYQISMA